MMRLAFAVLCFAASLLAVLRAPTYHLWMFSIVVTEWGHLLALISLLPLAPGWRRSKYGQAASGVAVAAAVLFLTPLIRSRTVASALPAKMEAVFGPFSGSPSVPFTFKNLLMGVPLPPVRQATHVYDHSCGEDLKLELYRPMLDENRSWPIVLIIHGGSWQSGDRLELDPLSRYLASRGYAVASIDYGLAPRSTFPGPVDDARDAVAYLRRNAAELNLDPSRLAVLGRSAGGQIALSFAHSPEPVPGLKAAVVFYGPNDLFLAWRVPGPKRMIDSRRLLRQYLGGSPADQPERYALASPLLRAGKASPPTLMIHGGRDEMVWPLHEYRLSEKLAAAGVPHFFLDLPWATHGCDYNFNGPCGQLSTYAVERFLSYALKP
ncbi:MAG: alpha/beta hydrolase [Elusimicrobiota bacterium]|nr:MAG: alpha/beta hydrolase [Elusimicrobiota bacterium]